MDYTTLVSAETLKAHLDDPRWAIFDVRHDLFDLDAGPRAYRAGHVPGAQFASIDNDLSGAKTGRNGRHPLPNRDALVARFRAWGFGNDSSDRGVRRTGRTVRRAAVVAGTLARTCARRGPGRRLAGVDRGRRDHRDHSGRARRGRLQRRQSHSSRSSLPTPCSQHSGSATACCSTRACRSATAASRNRSIRWPATFQAH